MTIKKLLFVITDIFRKYSFHFFCKIPPPICERNVILASIISYEGVYHYVVTYSFTGPYLQKIEVSLKFHPLE